jgi:hypothetical protein
VKKCDAENFFQHHIFALNFSYLREPYRFVLL